MDLQSGKEEILIDANVILRYLLKDNEELYEEAERIFDSTFREEIKAYIPTFIVAEVVYVLQKVYKINRETIAKILIELLRSKAIITDNKTLLFKALDIFQEKNLDFADCLLCAYGERYKVVSFDRKLNKCLSFLWSY